MSATPVKDQIVEFVATVAGAMGLHVTVTGTEAGEGVRVDIEGEGSEAFLFQRGEALRALQTIVNIAFRRQLGEDGRVLVDCQGFRRDKDAELRQTAKFLAEKVLQNGSRAGDGAAQLVRAPHRPPGRGRDSRRELREHRRRVREESDHLGRLTRFGEGP